MGSTLKFVTQHWQALVVPLIVVSATMLVGLAVRRVVFRTLHRWAAGAQSKVEDVVVSTLRGPFLIWVLMLGLHLGAQTSKLPAPIRNAASQTLLVLFIVSMTIVFSRLAGILIQVYAGAASFTSLTGNVVRIVIAVMGAMIGLNVMGISVLPILTALGVGGIAIALALQDTLSNLFAGFYISVAGQIRLGDYIKLDSGEEGYIGDITWRSTSIRSLSGNIIIVPNAKLAKATITNYDLVSQSMSVSVAVSVSYDSDFDHVEGVLLDEVLQATGHVPGLLAEPPASVSFSPGFGPYSMDLTLSVRVQKFVDQYLVQHELRKRILRRFRKEKINIPFPTRTIFMHPDNSAAPDDGKQS